MPKNQTAARFSEISRRDDSKAATEVTPLRTSVKGVWYLASPTVGNTYQREERPLELLDLRVPSTYLERQPFHRLRQLRRFAVA